MEEETDSAGAAPRRDEEGRTSGSAAGRHRAALSDDNWARSAADADLHDAAHLLDAVVVRVVGSGDGGRAV